MISEKQHDANKSNARLSVGPVTPEGRAVVARNAVKHGIFAKDLVISAGDGAENEFEYQELLAGLENDLAPIGRMETLLVEKIAVNYWRLRRLVRYETGEIQERLDNFKENALDSYYDRPQYSRTRPEMSRYDYGDSISKSAYQEQLMRLDSMKNSDFDLTKDKDSLEYVCYQKLNKRRNGLSDSDYGEAKNFVIGLSRRSKAKLTKEILEAAEQLLFEMCEVLIWQDKFDSIHKTNSLPNEQDLNKIIKYENSLERSIFRNLAALKALQTDRPGPIG